MKSPFGTDGLFSGGELLVSGREMEFDIFHFLLFFYPKNQPGSQVTGGGLEIPDPCHIRPKVILRVTSSASSIKGILAAPPKATPPRNKGLIRPY